MRTSTDGVQDMTIYDEIRAALAGATPGPWSQGGPWHNWIMADRLHIAAIARDENGGWSRHNARLLALTPTTAEMALRLEAADRLAEHLAIAISYAGPCDDWVGNARAALAAYRQKEGGE